MFCLTVRLQNLPAVRLTDVVVVEPVEGRSAARELMFPADSELNFHSLRRDPADSGLS